MTLTKDGKLLTIDIKFLMQQQKLFGAIARSKLASKLQREGIELEFNNPDKGIYRVNGIPRELEEHFSQRTAEIIRAQKKLGENNATTAQLAITPTIKETKVKQQKKIP